VQLGVRGHLGEQLACPRLAPLRRDEPRDERVAGALQAREVEQARARGGGARGDHGVARELELQPRDLLAQRLLRRPDPLGDLHTWTVPRLILVVVARNDPSDTGGLFIGRRPGTGPIQYRDAPRRGGDRRRRADAVAAATVLVVEALLCLSVWGPQPAGWLWIGSQVNYWTGSVFLGIVVAFLGVIATLFLTLSLCTRLDRVWRLLRRAAGHDQREGVLGRIFATTAVIAAVAFGFWFVVIQGPGPELAPR
jgi:hypothetical protein